MSDSTPYFYTASVSHARSCHTIKGSPALMLVLKNRGEAGNDIELSLENGDNSIDTFLLKPADGFLRLGPSTFRKICYKKVTKGEKVRLDIAVLR